MAPLTDPESLKAAWRALSEIEEGTGWITIPMLQAGPVRLLAARHFPGNQEAILAGFSSEVISEGRILPNGRGFVVSRVEPDSGQPGGSLISLVRQKEGSLDLFTAMAEDIFSFLISCKANSERQVLSAFLARIEAWQYFMGDDETRTLGREAEVGLVGELLLLRDLVNAGIHPMSALEAWRGPLGELHDFVIGRGSIEVKSTIAPSGIPAKIGSLEQLDESLVNPLFLVCVRVPLDDHGKTLPDFINEVGEVFKDDTIAYSCFGSRVMRAGYSDLMSGSYTRRFKDGGRSAFPVVGALPRLTRYSVPIGVRVAQYQIELEGLGLEEVTIPELLTKLGVS